MDWGRSDQFWLTRATDVVLMLEATAPNQLWVSAITYMPT
jgi:hypothetical protein